MVKTRLVINKTFLFFMFVNILAISVVLFNHFMFAHVELMGKSNVILNYKEEYIEKGFTATRVGKDISDEVLVTGKVNTSKLGKYKITYEVTGLCGKSGPEASAPCCCACSLQAVLAVQNLQTAFRKMN